MHALARARRLDALHLSNLVWTSTNAKVECAAFLTHAAEVAAA